MKKKLSAVRQIARARVPTFVTIGARGVRVRESGPSETYIVDSKGTRRASPSEVRKLAKRVRGG